MDELDFLCIPSIVEKDFLSFSKEFKGAVVKKDLKGVDMLLSGIKDSYHLSLIIRKESDIINFSYLDWCIHNIGSRRLYIEGDYFKELSLLLIDYGAITDEYFRILGYMKICI